MHIHEPSLNPTLLLQIDDKHLDIIDYADIQDGKTVQWNMVTVNELLRQAVDRQAISTVLFLPTCLSPSFPCNDS